MNRTDILFLFVPWALTCWLRTCPFVGVPLRSLDEAAVQAVLEHLETSVLGATVTSDTRPRDNLASWKGLLEAVKAVFAKLSNLSLSAFGRAHAGASYGVSKLLFHAEHETLPEAVAGQLERLTKAFVDRQNGKVPGVPSALLFGKPASSGFGALPWKQHILARHAHAGFRFIKQVLATQPSGAHSRPLWVSMAATLLTRAFPSSHPTLALLRAASPRAPLGALSSPLQRMALGLQALGPLQVVAAPDPGPWCAALPLWDNPHFFFELSKAERCIVWLGLPPTNQLCGFPALKHLPGLHTLADLLLLWDHLEGWRGAYAGQPGVHRSDLFP